MQSKIGTKGESESGTKSGTKSEPKSRSKRQLKAPKVTRKKKSEIKMEEKSKLAGFIKEEDLIHNINNKLHSNAPAMVAAWQRVATKMDKSGKKFLLF